MAEKKERTLHIVQKLDGRFAGVSSMTRQEAIERMAKAMNEAYIDRNKDYIFHFGLLAEAALNALLSEGGNK